MKRKGGIDDVEVKGDMKGGKGVRIGGRKGRM